MAGPASILWCCHVRASDDVFPAPDFATALKWADWYYERFDVPTIKGGDPHMPVLRAVPAPWPHSPELHAEHLAETIADFRGA